MSDSDEIEPPDGAWLQFIIDNPNEIHRMLDAANACISQLDEIIVRHGGPSVVRGTAVLEWLNAKLGDGGMNSHAPLVPRAPGSCAHEWLIGDGGKVACRKCQEVI